jgi:hypothetical protein
MSSVRGSRISILGAGAFVAAGVGLAAAVALRRRTGPEVLLPAGLGYGAAVAATLAGFAFETRAAARGQLAFLRGLGLGFAVKLVLLAGGAVAVWLAGMGRPEAYVIAFLAGFLVAGAAGVLHVRRAFPAGRSRMTGGSDPAARG